MSSERVYGRMTCPSCRKKISCAGGGVSHMRMHVKAGDKVAKEWFKNQKYLKDLAAFARQRRAFLRRHEAEARAMGLR